MMNESINEQLDSLEKSQELYISEWIQMLAIILNCHELQPITDDIKKALHSVKDALEKYPMDNSIGPFISDVSPEVFEYFMLHSDGTEEMCHSVRDSLALSVDLTNVDCMYNHCYFGRKLVLSVNPIKSMDNLSVSSHKKDDSDNLDVSFEDDMWTLNAVQDIYRRYFMEVLK